MVKLWLAMTAGLLELAGFVLREVEYLVDETKERRWVPAANPRGETTMRFMGMEKHTKDSEAGKMASEELLSAMGKFNEEMVKAGVMLDGNGLQPSSKGASSMEAKRPLSRQAFPLFGQMPSPLVDGENRLVIPGLLRSRRKL